MKMTPKYSPGRIVSSVLAVLSIVWLAACSSTANAGLSATSIPTLVLEPLASDTQTPAAVDTTTPPAPTATLAASATASATASPTAVQTAASTTAAAAPTCSSPADLTPAVTEGPYFKAGSPLRANLIDPDMVGKQLDLSGYVLTADCKPVANALLDFWQTDPNGNYDNIGYTLRGHQFTDANGHFLLTTLIPGLYPGRTEHIHVKVQKPNGPVLTTQLFFPGVSNNSSDGIYDPKLLINVLSSGTNLQAMYTFIIH